MSQSTRNVQFLRPTYDGETKTLPEHVQINEYFKSTDISHWNLGDYLIYTGLSETSFLKDLAELQKIKRLPTEITMFAHALYKHYEGELGTEKIKLARVNARKELGTLMLNSMERVRSKMAAENELDLEIAGGRSPQAEPRNPFLVPPPITTSCSALYPRESKARPAVFPIVTNASSSTSTGSIPGDMTSEESTEDESHRMPDARIETPTTATAPAATKSSRSPRKKRKMEYTTEEPWRSLLVVLQQIINGERSVVFPVAPAEMVPVHKLLFNHAVDAMKSYLAQPIDARDALLLKDAQCSMSCVLNTMSGHVSMFFEESDEEELFGAAKDHCLIAGFEDHGCSTILVEYLPVLREKGTEYLRRRLIADRGKLASDYLDGPSLPPTAVLRDQVLHILLELCDHILHPPYGKVAPSENDCLHYWVRIFSILTNKVTILTGEKALEASKVVRRQQAAEYGEVSEAGRKVDCLFAFESIELSNIEFKLRGALDKEIAIQNRKNIRLARALQEAHARHGAGDVSVFMADVAVATGTVRNRVFSGFVGTFYQTRLEAQGVELMKAYDVHDRQQEINRHADGLSLGRPRTPPRHITTIRNNVVLSPSKRRNVATTSENK
ncbi:hypothetical protein EC968_002140 [Mortierella alpina]|nr:hypothetical protein EC968_002140 [Mortierella alpina]